ncbi:TetR/AcrR family transcriptional regulator [Brachyspira catarrhinii]|uniref:TetR/AcrR family transcriptional regulator n=1 Tax=Brachyspira catarrhinii TaxID=2528966 RepID=A0ABY2TQ46_9SPIR|nr:helix-turn-helix domain-containing protein [Brachyspira catarrhinii]TKZ34811.1 TetR/AcrR family transcriptional regulator [Brachyspira catarrhinii]
MPKVSKEYFDNKRKIILDAALKVFSKKPSYTVSMKDIIKESKLSQGGVYKYYSNIDDIIISLINRNKILVSPKDIIKDNYNNPKKVIFEFLKEFTNYFFEATKECGKIFFELYPILINDKKRLKRYANKTNSITNPNYWFEELFDYLDDKTKTKYFNPVSNSSYIYFQITSIMRGIGTELILTKYYNKKGEYKIDLEMKLDDLAESIYKTILFLMGSKELNKIKRIKN